MKLNIPHLAFERESIKKFPVVTALLRVSSTAHAASGPSHFTLKLEKNPLTGQKF